MKRLVIYRDSLIGSHHTQVPDNIVHRDPVEVICLATRQDSRQNLMFFSCSKNKDSVCRRFLKGLEESIERRLRQHMHLVDDINTVLSHLRRYTYLVHQRLDVIHSVIGSGIKLMDAVGTSFSKRKTRFTLSARLHILRRIGAVYHLCEDTGSGGLTHPSRSAEEVCMRKLTSEY